MVDREKIIKALESLRDRLWDAAKQDAIATLDASMVTDAIALLKEQEPVEPKQVGSYGKRNWYGVVYVCPYCNAAWMGDRIDTHFCPECGKAVKCGG